LPKKPLSDINFSPDLKGTDIKYGFGSKSGVLSTYSIISIINEE
jgi:hypothetical protein